MLEVEEKRFRKIEIINKLQNLSAEK